MAVHTLAIHSAIHSFIHSFIHFSQPGCLYSMQQPDRQAGSKWNALHGNKWETLHGNKWNALAWKQMEDLAALDLLNRVALFGNVFTVWSRVLVIFWSWDRQVETDAASLSMGFLPLSNCCWYK